MKIRSVPSILICLLITALLFCACDANPAETEPLTDGTTAASTAEDTEPPTQEATEAPTETEADTDPPAPEKTYVLTDNGGEDGLDFYRGIISLYEESLEDDGFFAFEIGYDQAKGITLLAQNHGMSIEIIKDLSGNDRVAILKK